jgi:cytochrome o ubiquinol oxidase subunit 1
LQAKHLANNNEAEAPHYKSITMPKNSSIAPIIGALSVAFGFGMIWHIWWLTIASLVAIIVSIIIRISDDNTDFVVPASKIEEIELGYSAKRALAPKEKYA